MSNETLRITEIFYSLQGESSTVGHPTVFIRLTGCPLRCSYCDTAYAFSGGESMALADILAQVAHYDTRFVTVTGGEPLAQKACPALLIQLADRGYQVSLETSGALDITAVDPRIMIVMDLKTPGSNEAEQNRYANLNTLKPTDQIKLVIRDESDYQWTKQLLQTHRLAQCCEVLLSPATDQLAPTQLADWILQDQLPVRFQLQLHKILWGDTPGK